MTSVEQRVYFVTVKWLVRDQVRYVRRLLLAILLYLQSVLEFVTQTSGLTKLLTYSMEQSPS